MALLFSTAQQPLLDLGLLIIAASRRQTPHSVGLIWTSDQPDTETSTWRHTTDRQTAMLPGRIRSRNPNKRAAADTRHSPRSHWDSQHGLTPRKILSSLVILRKRQTTKRGLSSQQQKYIFDRTLGKDFPTRKFRTSWVRCATAHLIHWWTGMCWSRPALKHSTLCCISPCLQILLTFCMWHQMGLFSYVTATICIGHAINRTSGETD